MTSFAFTVQAEKTFHKKISHDVQKRVINKLKELKSHPDIFHLLKPLAEFNSATHRLRIGRYRIILKLINFDKTNLEFLVIDIGDRKNIYRW